MILSDFLRALGRRWYVLAVGVVVTAGLAIGAYIISPPNYTARGLVILLPSEQAVADGGNPFLALGELDLPARILVSYFQSESAQDDVAEVSPDADYAVSIEESTRGPIIAIDVQDVSADSALATLTYIANEVPTNLERLQTEVAAPPATFVRSMELTMDDEAQEDLSGTIRIVIAAAAAGLVATLVLTFAIDRMRLGSGRRRGQGRRDSAAGSRETTADSDDQYAKELSRVGMAARRAQP